MRLSLTSLELMCSRECSMPGVYIDQSQSLNIHMIDANQAKLSSMHFYGPPAQRPCGALGRIVELSTQAQSILPSKSLRCQAGAWA